MSESYLMAAPILIYQEHQITRFRYDLLVKIVVGFLNIQRHLTLNNSLYK